VTVLPESEAREALTQRVGEPLRQSALDRDKEALIDRISEQGYPHAKGETRVAYSEDRTRADIVHRIDEGPHVSLKDIFISGNLRTREKVIRRELEVAPGSSLSLRELHDGQRQLRDLDIFHGVRYRLPGLKKQGEAVDLFVEVEEKKPYYAEIGGGYESDSGFFGRTRIGDRNLFGLNKELWAGAEVSQTGHRLEARLTEPRFLGTRTTASIGAFTEELAEFNQSFGTRTTGGTLGFSREWISAFSSSLVFSLEERDIFDVEGQTDTPAAEESRTIFVTTPTIAYDNRDSFVRPTRGFYTALSGDISKGFENRLDDFVRYQFDTRCYFTPVKRLTFAGLARFGQVLSYSGSDAVPDDQLFFLGGIGDIRGYRENMLRFDESGTPVGGRRVMVGSLEARIDLGLNWELATFYDIGSVQDTRQESGSDRFRSTVGLGLRYITPIGPMGLLYGYKLDREEGESAGQLHISIGYSF
jgi:outer membrane protein insertion porin family